MDDDSLDNLLSEMVGPEQAQRLRNGQQLTEGDDLTEEQDFQNVGEGMLLNERFGKLDDRTSQKYNVSALAKSAKPGLRQKKQKSMKRTGQVYGSESGTRLKDTQQTQ